MDLQLDKQSLKALANDTRVEILKQLDKRRYTHSELAGELELSVPTIKEHCEALVKAGLIERQEEGRKWKYYSLTKKGRGVLRPEELRIWIVLSMLVLSAVGAVATFVNRLAPEPLRARTAVAEGAMAEAMMAPASMEPAVSYWFWVFAIAAGLLVIVALVLFIRQHRHYQQLGKTLNK